MHTIHTGCVKGVQQGRRVGRLVFQNYLQPLHLRRQPHPPG